MPRSISQRQDTHARSHKIHKNADQTIARLAVESATPAHARVSLGDTINATQPPHQLVPDVKNNTVFSVRISDVFLTASQVFPRRCRPLGSLRAHRPFKEPIIGGRCYTFSSSIQNAAEKRKPNTLNNITNTRNIDKRTLASLIHSLCLCFACVSAHKPLPPTHTQTRTHTQAYRLATITPGISHRQRSLCPSRHTIHTIRCRSADVCSLLFRV